MDKTERELLAEISEKLDRLIALFATQGKTEDQQIHALRGMGFDWKFIGSLVGLKPATARKRYERAPKG